jgi:hypothetical protein
MRRLRRNHQTQLTIDRLGAAARPPRGPAAPAPASWLRAAPRASRVPARLPARDSSGAGSTTRLPAQGSSGGAACPHGSGSHLPAQGSSGALRVPAAPVPTSRLRAAPGPPCVSWAPAPASRHRTAPGAPRVPTAPGQMKTVEPSSSENRAPDE